MALASKSGFMKQLRVQLVTTRERTRGRKEGLLMVILGGRTTSILIMKGSSQSTTNWCYHCITQGLRMPTTYRSSFSRLATSNHMIQSSPVLPEASISLRDRQNSKNCSPMYIRLFRTGSNQKFAKNQRSSTVRLSCARQLLQTSTMLAAPLE